VSPPSATLERVAKLTILVSLSIAVWMQAWFVGLAELAAGAFVAAWIAERFRPARARQGVLLLTYLLPALFVFTRERFAEIYSVLWVALLCGE